MLRRDPYTQAFAAKQARALQLSLERKRVAGQNAFNNYIKMWQNSGVPLQNFVQNSQDTFTGLAEAAGLSADNAFNFMVSARDKPVSVGDIGLYVKSVLATNEVESGGLPGGEGGQGYDSLDFVQGTTNPTTESIIRFVDPNSDLAIKARAQQKITNAENLEFTGQRSATEPILPTVPQYVEPPVEYTPETYPYANNVPREPAPIYVQDSPLNSRHPLNAPPQNIFAGGKDPLNEYEQSTGDTHRPALIGDQEAVVNKEGVKALEKIFGPDFFTKLQNMFPNKDAQEIIPNQEVIPEGGLTAEQYNQANPVEYPDEALARREAQRKGLEGQIPYAPQVPHGGYPVPAFPDGRGPIRGAIKDVYDKFFGSSLSGYSPAEARAIFGVNPESPTFVKRQSIMDALDAIESANPNAKIPQDVLENMGRRGGVDMDIVTSRLKKTFSTAEEGAGYYLRSKGIPENRIAGIIAEAADMSRRVRKPALNTLKDITGSRGFRRAASAALPMLGTLGKIFASEATGLAGDLLQGTPPGAPGGLSSGELPQEFIDNAPYKIAPVSPEPSTEFSPEALSALKQSQTDLQRRARRSERRGEFDLPSYEEGRPPRYATGNVNETSIRVDPRQELERNAQLTPTGAAWERVPVRILQEEPDQWEVNTAIDQSTITGDGFIIARRKAPTGTIQRPPGPSQNVAYERDAQPNMIDAQRVLDPNFQIGVSPRDQLPSNQAPTAGIGMIQRTPELPTGPTPPEQPVVKEEEVDETPADTEVPELFKRTPKEEEGFYAGIIPGIEKAYADLAKGAPGMTQLMGLGNFVELYNADVLATTPEGMKNQLDYLKFLHDKEIDFLKLDLDGYKALSTDAYRKGQLKNTAATLIWDRYKDQADIDVDVYKAQQNRLEFFLDPLFAMQATALETGEINPHAVAAINEQLGGDYEAVVYYVPSGEKGVPLIGSYAEGKYATVEQYDNFGRFEKNKWTPVITIDGRPLLVPGLGGDSSTPEFGESLFEPSTRYPD